MNFLISVCAAINLFPVRELAKPIEADLSKISPHSDVAGLFLASGHFMQLEGPEMHTGSLNAKKSVSRRA
jgi:hypothetical protein